jgi:heparosan-N-sulfate-glucuronate 5-epimerase
MHTLLEKVIEYTQNDFWHTKRILGRNIKPNTIGGYYLNLINKTAEYKGEKSDLGIPLVKSGNKYYLHPVTVCQVALGYHDKWLEYDSSQCLDRFMELANWLVNHQEKKNNGRGVWPIPYGVPIYGLKPGWISSLVQGQAISVLVRAHHETHNDKFLITSELAFHPFQINIADGGVCRYDKEGNIFYEEYPTIEPSCVLNGFISSLWGLYDYAVYTNNSEAKGLFDQGINSLKSSLNLYDTGYWSRYSLFRKPGVSNLASPYYHQEHITQLRATAILTNEPHFEETAKRWEKYSSNLMHIGRVLYKKGFSRLYTKFRYSQ